VTAGENTKLQRNQGSNQSARILKRKNCELCKIGYSVHGTVLKDFALARETLNQRTGFNRGQKNHAHQHVGTASGAPIRGAKHGNSSWWGHVAILARVLYIAKLGLVLGLLA